MEALAHYHGLPIHLTDALTVEAPPTVDHAIDQGQPRGARAASGARTLRGSLPRARGERGGGQVRVHYLHVWLASLLGQRQGYAPHSAMRLGDWKVVYFYEVPKI